MTMDFPGPSRVIPREEESANFSVPERYASAAADADAEAGGGR